MTAAPGKPVVRVGAVGDLHCPRTPASVLEPLLGEIARSCDVLALCGDLTDRGTPEEAQVLARELTKVVKIPIVAVLGNHDYESGRHDEVKAVLSGAGVSVLDGEACEILGVGFAGVKGFGGGFGQRALQPWGEETIKRFVREAVEEALRFESALARLRTRERFGLLHYSPIQSTVEGEPPEIFAFLGSSRLEEPLARYPVRAVFHAHAHRGRPEGKTRQDVPVFNVSLPLLQSAFPDRPAFHLIEALTADSPESTDGDSCNSVNPPPVEAGRHP